ncbi:isocitrate lyase/phosphoenolpyruvate mutase family protein [Mucilaginibacter sabulilitoris]|uniref:Isocitrate lyase/phosphoenolpyruvate mutase family protein n=1 Tax=Mucilaginibacter sabulilitoris TaxID=1173583 RepID=A0ABZ0TLM4_9SPHI|nr:isocitrate lyase/phosphoenolpyruvate mutase family protein [Mucilaginibacter sabulilitoris]WPU93706.1 isocitrate lyase/phosphoenolpyruvate mutase family protein [Mucilaginibacter sabulilitoris]
MNNYEKFFQLHHQEKPFIIANAWNVKSAQIIENNGYDAVATSSGAIANSLGYEDGEKIPFSELFYIVQRIKSCTSIPLSVDLETGYANDLTKLNDNIQKLIDIGVVGINLEDAQGEEIYLKKLNSIKNYLTKNNQALFINARTDGFLQKLDSPFERILKRAKLYEDAGADGLFVTAVQDAALIKEITSSVSLPVNVVGVPKLSSIETLSNCGVKRISMAVFLYKKTYNQLENVVRDINTEQSLAPLF